MLNALLIAFFYANREIWTSAIDETKVSCLC